MRLVVVLVWSEDGNRFFGIRSLSSSWHCVFVDI